VKLFLFKTIAFITGSIVSINVSIGNTVTNAIAFIFNSINAVIKNIASYLMILIDKDRYIHANLTVQQSSTLTEFNLLATILKVKEDAMANRMWTISHTMMMNQVGNALHVQCNWEPARIHKYLKSVIETIPGMVYTAGDDFDDQASV
jgi:DNA-binding PucR family transcriptional regulator